VRRVDVETLDALGGSRPADTLTVWAWRAGKLVVPEPLMVKDWSFDDDAGGQRKGWSKDQPDGCGS